MRFSAIHLLVGATVFLTVTGSGWSRPSQADLTGNGKVQEGDLIQMVDHLKRGDLRGDVFLDGRVDHRDLLELLLQWRGSLTTPADRLVIRVGGPADASKSHDLDLLDLSVANDFKTTTRANVSQAFLCFDKMEIQAPGGPPRVVFEAVSGPGKVDLGLGDLAVDKGLSGSTAPSPLRKVELTGLDPAGQILAGVDFQVDRLNWIRLRVVEGFPNTYVVLPTGATADLEVPSGSFKIIAPGNQVMLGGGSPTELTIEFDPGRSILKTGDDRYKLKPVTKLRVNQADVGDASTEFE